MNAPVRSFLRWLCSRQAGILFLALVLIAVVGLSLYPRPEEVLGPWSLNDKAGHFAAYVVLAFLSVRAVNRRDVLSLILTIASCTALGGLIEIVQPLVGRTRELMDFIVDLGGSAVGAGIGFLIRRKGSRARPVR
jgi:VanZ family protein